MHIYVLHIAITSTYAYICIRRSVRALCVPKTERRLVISFFPQTKYLAKLKERKTVYRIGRNVLPGFKRRVYIIYNGRVCICTAREASGPFFSREKHDVPLNIEEKKISGEREILRKIKRKRRGKFCIYTHESAHDDQRIDIRIARESFFVYLYILIHVRPGRVVGKFSSIDFKGGRVNDFFFSSLSRARFVATCVYDIIYWTLNRPSGSKNRRRLVTELYDIISIGKIFI